MYTYGLRIIIKEQTFCLTASAIKIIYIVTVINRPSTEQPIKTMCAEPDR